MELKSSLNRIRRRLQLRVFINSLVLCLGLALAAVGLLLIAATWTQWQLPASTTLLTVAAAAVITALLVTLIRSPSASRTARILEAADPELHTRFSTALELSQTDSGNSPLRQALLNDATEQAVRLIPTERVPLKIPRARTAWLAGGIAVMVAGMFFSAPLTDFARSPASVTQTDSAGFTDDEQETLASNLQQLADIFAEREASQSDQYMQAISRQLQDLGERLSQETMDRDQLAAELERLLQHTQSALELQDSTQARREIEDLSELLQAALREADGSAESLLADESGVQPDDGALPDAAQGEQSGEAGVREAQLQPPSLEDLLEAGSQDSGNQQSQETGSSQASSSGSYYDQAIDERTIAELNQRALEQSLTQAAGEAIGASTESEAGASSLAGEGSDDLFGSEDAARLNAERLEQMAVPEETDPEGRRVRVEMTPEAELTEVRMTPLGQTVWNRSTESAVERETITTSQRLVTARYHTPEQAE